jgi:hypothetical protein
LDVHGNFFQKKDELGWVKKFEHLLDVLQCERRASGGRGPCQGAASN